MRTVSRGYVGTGKVMLMLSFVLLTAVILFVGAEAKTTIELWTIDHSWSELMEKAIADFEAAYPDIDVKIQYMATSWPELSDKLLMGAATGVLPTATWSHTDHNFRLEKEGLFAPVPWNELPFEPEDFFSYASAYQYEGEYYRFPWGWQNGLLYYNEDLLAEAGVSTGNIPTSISGTTKLARKLTKVDAAGEVTQFGYGNTDPWWQWIDAFYQQGEYMVKEDGTPNFASAAGTIAFEQLLELLEAGAGGTVQLRGYDGFFNGKEAMTYAWAWVAAVAEQNNPDLNFGVTSAPTITGSLEPAYGRMNAEEGFAVLRKASPEEQAAAWKLLAFLVNDDEFLRGMTLNGMGLPFKQELWYDDEIKQDPVLTVQAQTLPYSIFQGEMGFAYDILGKYLARAFRREISPTEALKGAETEAWSELQGGDYRLLERHYIFEK